MALDSWSGHVLVIEGGNTDAFLTALSDYGFRVSTADTGGRGLRILEDTRPLVVVASLELTDVGGLAILHRVQELDPDVPVILVGTTATSEEILEALSAGAFDRVARSTLAVDGVLTAVERAVQHTRKLAQLRETHEREQARFFDLEETVRSLRSQLAVTELSLAQARAQAAEADRAKSSFLANMSHELRTPLNAILGYTELLSEDAPNPERAHDLRRIHGAGSHLLRLISDVLDLARIESGKSELYYETARLPAILQQAADRLAPRLGNNTLQMGTIPDVELVTDVAKFGMILDRVLGNASKFTTDGMVEISGRDTNGRMQIIVRDTGIGMNPAQTQTIFREFSQGDGSTTRRFGGTGLGLTIALRLTKLLNGTIQVESELGDGSTFILDFPSTPPEWDEMLTEAVPHAPVALDKPTVLVIDGDATLRRKMSTYLTKAGYRVISTGSGSEGMRIARLQKPAIISLDVVLPDVDGWNLLMAFKSDQELREIPVVLVTVAGDRSRGLAVGAADFLPKPIRRESLLAVMRRVGPARDAGPILVVEDDDDTRDVTCRMLRAEGWDAEAVENGRIALEWLEDHDAPALILLDLMMPEVDGFHVITELQLREEWRQIPVVVFTAMDVPPARLAFLENHVESVIRKGGYGQAQVLEEVRGLIARSLIS